MYELVECDKLLALPRKQLLWGFKFQDNVKLLSRVHILNDKFLSVTEDLSVDKNEAGILGPGVLAIVQEGPSFVEGLPGLDFVSIVEGFFHKLHLILLLDWLWSFLNMLSRFYLCLFN